MPPFCNFIFVIGAADSYDRMRITETTVQSFKVAKIFKENTDKINSVTFSQSGEFLISSSNDDSIVIYDCVQGNPKRTLNSKKYGVDLIQLTHSNDTVSLPMFVWLGFLSTTEFTIPSRTIILQGGCRMYVGRPRSIFKVG